MTVIITTLGVIVLLLGLLQSVLIVWGLISISSVLVSKERLSWFDSWAVTHLFMIIVRVKQDTQLKSVMERYHDMALQFEGLQIGVRYVVLPLVVSFLLSQILDWFRDSWNKKRS